MDRVRVKVYHAREAGETGGAIVKYRLDVNDEDLYEPVRDELVGGFDSWAGRHKVHADPSLAGLFCDYKVWYGDGNLVRWSPDEVEELLVEWFPRKIDLDEESISITVSTLRAFCQYLAFEGILEGGPPTALDRCINRLAPRFREAMTDRSSFGLAKTIFGLMDADGIDITDPQATQAWIDAFNERPERERRALIPSPFGFELDDLPSDDEIELPGVRLALPAELATRAAEAPALRRLRAFAAFAGDGRRLTVAGNIPPSDGGALLEALGIEIPDRMELGRVRSTADLPGVDLVFGWSRAANFVRVARGRVAATKAGRGIDRDPLAAWLRALEGLVKMRPTRRRHPENSMLGRPFWADMIDASIPDLLGLLYARGVPVSFDEIVDGMWSDVEARYLVPDHSLEFVRRAHRRDIEALFDDLDDLAVAVRTGFDVLLVRWAPGDDGPTRSEELLTGEDANTWMSRLRSDDDGFSVFSERLGGMVSLTPLGLWGANRLLRARGIHAPVIGEHADADARTMLRGACELDPQAFEQEVRHWLDVHGEDGCDELAAVAADTDPLIRISALSALGTVTDRAAPSVRRLAEDPASRPFAMAWLVEHGLEDLSEMSRSDAPTVLAATLAALVQIGDAEAAAAAFASLGPESDQVRSLDELWRAPAPDAGPALEAIAAHHSSRAVAKHARKMLLKLRTANLA